MKRATHESIVIRGRVVLVLSRGIPAKRKRVARASKPVPRPDTARSPKPSPRPLLADVMRMLAGGKFHRELWI